MNMPLMRIRSGALVLGAIVLASIIGYRYWFDYDWIESIWLTTITLSSVGYSETSTVSHGQQIFTVLVIVFGMIAVGYTVGGMIQLMAQGEIQRVLGHNKTCREIDRLSGHTIICGYGRIGSALADELERLREPFVIIEQDERLLEELAERRRLAMHGDAANDRDLIRAGIARAKSVACCLPNDAANVFTTLTARNLNQDVQIIARAEHRATIKKLEQAGVTRMVMPTMIGAHQMSRLILRPSATMHSELQGIADSIELEMDEITIGPDSPLIGRTIGSAATSPDFQLMIVAAKPSGGKTIFHPDQDFILHEGDHVVVVGGREDLESFDADKSAENADSLSASST